MGAILDAEDIFILQFYSLILCRVKGIKLFTAHLKCTVYAFMHKGVCSRFMFGMTIVSSHSEVRRL